MRRIWLVVGGGTWMAGNFGAYSVAKEVASARGNERWGFVKGGVPVRVKGARSVVFVGGNGAVSIIDADKGEARRDGAPKAGKAVDASASTWGRRRGNGRVVVVLGVGRAVDAFKITMERNWVS